MMAYPDYFVAAESTGWEKAPTTSSPFSPVEFHRLSFRPVAPSRSRVASGEVSFLHSPDEYLSNSQGLRHVESILGAESVRGDPSAEDRVWFSTLGLCFYPQVSRLAGTSLSLA